MRSFITEDPVPATVAEGVKLFDVSQPQRGLVFHPGTQADFEGAVTDRIEWTKRKAVECCLTRRVRTALSSGLLASLCTGSFASFT